MLVVGLTGGIGCGKSIVSNLFHQEYKIPIIDADIIARELSQKDHVCDLIFEKIGSEYFDDNRVLLREKLRKAVFTDFAIRSNLEEILHPLVYQEIGKRLLTIDTDYCIVVVPLLLETQQVNFVDRVLVVDCTVEEQIQRVMSRDQCTETDVRNIIATQLDREQRLKLADDIIENHDSIDSLKKKVAILHEKYIAIIRTEHSM